MSVRSRISAFESLTTNADPIDFLESPPSTMTSGSLQPATRPSPSPSPPSLGRKTSLIDLKDWVVDDGAFRPSKWSSSSHIGISQPKSANATKRPSQERVPTGIVPLIDLHSPPKPKPKLKPKPNLTGSTQAATSKHSPPQLPPRKASHTSLESTAATSPQIPQLNFLYPPRRQDQILEPNSKSSASHAPTSSISSFHSVSLSSDTDTSRPGSISNFVTTLPIERDQSLSVNSRPNDVDSVSLAESYEEVSASTLASPVSDEKVEWQYTARKPPKLPERPPSTNPSMKMSPSQPRGGQLKAAAGSGPPSPVSQPSLSRHSSASTLNNAAPPYSPYAPRRAAPPPPPPPSRSSDRSSILSNATTQSFSSHSSHSYQQLPPLPGAPTVAFKIKRPTPVPLAARKRFEALFVKNILQQKKAKANEKPSTGLLSPPSEVAKNRRAAGWRGISVDLIVDPEGPTSNSESKAIPQGQRDKETTDEAPDNNDKLEGAVVRLIWRKSRLDSTRLAEIWNECDLTGQGALNLDGFVKGMWRIDEELRRIQSQTFKSTNSKNLGLYHNKSIRSPPASSPIPIGPVRQKVLPRYKDILR